MSTAHDHRISEGVWDWSWREFKQLPKVDTYEMGTGGRGRLRRADLFVRTTSGGIVSFEFKYVAPHSSLNAAASVKQIKQHLRGHKACIFVVYAGGGVSKELARDLRIITKRLVGRPAFIVPRRGSAV